MTNPRTYGNAPYALALLHGGPGAGGEMAPLARRLSPARGALEPIQTANSLEGQITELKTQLEKHAFLPVVLAGYSWGAWLAYLTAACHPNLVRKLVLISAGSFDACFVEEFQEQRLNRLSPEETVEIASLAQQLDDPLAKDKETALARFGAIFSKTDSFDPLPEDAALAGDLWPPRPDIFQGVWKDAEALRKNGTLLELGKSIQCPVVAIHGDYDPHPARGVAVPLGKVIKDFKFVLLENCGHTPWMEKQAQENFYNALEQAII